MCSADNLAGKMKMIVSALNLTGNPRPFIQNSCIQINKKRESKVEYKCVSTPYIERVCKILVDHNITLSKKPSYTFITLQTYFKNLEDFIPVG